MGWVVPGGPQDTSQGKGVAPPEGVDEHRSQKMPKKEARANSWEGYVDLIDTRIDEPLILPAAADPREVYVLQRGPRVKRN